MNLIFVVIILTIIIALLIWWIVTLIKKNRKLKDEITFLKEQRDNHIRLEKETNEKINKLHSDNHTDNVNASAELMQELSQARR